MPIHGLALQNLAALTCYLPCHPTLSKAISPCPSKLQFCIKAQLGNCGYFIIIMYLKYLDPAFLALLPTIHGWEIRINLQYTFGRQCKPQFVDLDVKENCQLRSQGGNNSHIQVQEGLGRELVHQGSW